MWRAKTIQMSYMSQEIYAKSHIKKSFGNKTSNYCVRLKSFHLIKNNRLLVGNKNNQCFHNFMFPILKKIKKLLISV